MLKIGLSVNESIEIAQSPFADFYRAKKSVLVEAKHFGNIVQINNILDPPEYFRGYFHIYPSQLV